jgi:hypothetical protein
MVFFQRQAERSESYVVFVLHVFKRRQVYVETLDYGLLQIITSPSQQGDDSPSPPLGAAKAGRNHLNKG